MLPGAFFIDTPDKQKSLQDYLNMADQSMYENKRKKRTTKNKFIGVTVSGKPDLTADVIVKFILTV